jgi:phosphatidate cytidylyltransferase
MKRVITGIALAALGLYLIFWSADWGFKLAALCMGLLCYWEYAGLVAAHAIPKDIVFGALAGVVILFRPDWTIPAVSLLLILALISALRFSNPRDILPSVAAAFFGSFYTFAPWLFAIRLRHQSVHLLFFALALNWIGDTAAYYVGRVWGRHKLAPLVSPNKSLEGAGASVVACICFGLVYLGYLERRLPWWQIVLAAVLGNIAGQCGDLAESAMKRGAGVKDSSDLLPGHGGILDRVDSTMFALPAVYLLFVALQHWPL